MRNGMDVIKKSVCENTDVKIQQGVLCFSSSVQWVTDGLVDELVIGFDNMTMGRDTYLGAALEELNTKLSRNALMRYDERFFARSS